MSRLEHGHQVGQQSDLSASAHLVGVRGAGMRAMAELLLDRGWSVTGSDQTGLTEFEAAPPFPLSVGHAATNVPANVNLLIHSPAVPSENPERRAAQERGIRDLSYVEMLAELMQDRCGICISGTHGKTTTTAMVASILREAGLDPAVSVGGELVQYGRSGWWGAGPHLVVESCEYRRHFLEYRPTLAAILNIEPDHFDCFASLDDARSAFGAFAARIDSAGTLVVPFGDHAVQEAARQTTARVETFLHPQRSLEAASSGADWHAAQITTSGARTTFEVWYQGRQFGVVDLQVPGQHNVANALAAIALSHAAGAPASAICAALGRFRGVRRRFEILGEWRGVLVIDDYAHHPTAVTATIQSARQCFPDRRLICLFQPHQISRTQGLMSEFATCFAGADQVIFAPIYTARESADLADSTLSALVLRVAAAGIPAMKLTSLDRILACLDHAARPGDVLLIMGAGDINRIGYDLARTVS